MAELKYCPNCNQSKECTKKGKNAAGQQLWYCKECKKTFTLITETSPSKVKKVTSKVKKVAAPKKVTPKVKGTTEIIVNNNIIKTVPGFLTLDQAFDMVGAYFKEIAKEKATIKDDGDKKIITFKVATGTKNKK